MQNQPTRIDRRDAGFTLIELLVVISIVALLVAMLLPALTRARAVGKQITCASQIKQIGLSINMYATEYKEYIPPCKVLGSTAVIWNGYQHVNTTWSYLMRPYLNNNDNVWNCPSRYPFDPIPNPPMMVADPNWGNAWMQSYGLNYIYFGEGVPAGAGVPPTVVTATVPGMYFTKMNRIKHPSRLVMAGDNSFMNYWYDEMLYYPLFPESTYGYIYDRHPGINLLWSDSHVKFASRRVLYDEHPYGAPDDWWADL